MTDNSNENNVNEDKVENKQVQTKNQENKPEKEEKKSLKDEILEWGVALLVAVFIALLIRYFIFTPTMVMQTSMYPTLKEGERLYLSRMIRNFDQMPERGDIITFEQPDAFPAEGTVTAYYNKHEGVVDNFVRYFLEIGKRSFIKRVIALPGEHIEIASGKVYINGEILEEDYLVDGLETTNLDGEYYNLTVPEGYIFVMGDNRDGSQDSRAFGCIPFDKIEGKVLFRMWPLSEFGQIDKEE